MSYQGNYPPSTPLTSSQIAAGAVQPSNIATGNVTWTFNNVLNIGGTTPRITGDFSNATIASRLMFQTGTTNGASNVEFIPNGTNTTTNIIASNNSSDPANTSGASLTITNTEARVQSFVRGTGTALPLTFYTNSSERMRIDSSGNVGIGNPYAYNASFINAKISTVLSGTNNPYAAYYYPSSSGEVYVDAITSSSGGTQLVFRTYNNGTYNSSRFDANGTFIVGGSNPSVSSGVGFKADNAGITGCVVDTAVNANTYHFYNVNATNTGYRFYVNVNGGIYNYSANNSNLSDARVKKDIEDAPSYLDKLCSIPVKTFRFKDQDGDWKNLGVIAQEVEAVAPEFVDTDGWEAELPEDGIPLKSIYETDLKYAMLKAIQELKAQNDELKARIATLEAK